MLVLLMTNANLGWWAIVNGKENHRRHQKVEELKPRASDTENKENECGKQLLFARSHCLRGEQGKPDEGDDSVFSGMEG